MDLRVSNITGTGTYSVSNDCHGTASVTTQAGSSNYVFAISQDGQGILFVETDPGFTVGGTGQPQFSPAGQSVVNGASFSIADGGSGIVVFNLWKRVIDSIGDSPDATAP